MFLGFFFCGFVVVLFGGLCVLFFVFLWWFRVFFGLLVGVIVFLFFGGSRLCVLGGVAFAFFGWVVFCGSVLGVVLGCFVYVASGRL